MTALRGSCLCGGVRFEIDGPLIRSSHCHCRQCQKAHGAPFRTRARVAAADFRFLAGEELVSFYESTPGTHRGFCKVCGAQVLVKFDEQLAQLEFDKTAGFLINGLKREQLIAMNSMILHELFFDGLGDQSQPSTALRDAIARDFGSFERWRAEFVAMGKALGGGSGWVLLSWLPRDRKLVNQWAADHCHTLAGGTPILALDMYEHSYHMDFGAKAGSYVDCFYGGDPLAKRRKPFQGTKRKQRKMTWEETICVSSRR